MKPFLATNTNVSDRVVQAILETETIYYIIKQFYQTFKRVDKLQKNPNAV